MGLMSFAPEESPHITATPRLRNPGAFWLKAHKPSSLLRLLIGLCPLVFAASTDARYASPVRSAFSSQPIVGFGDTVVAYLTW